MEKVELVNQLRTSFLKERIASATSASVDIEVKSEESEQPDTMQAEKVFRVIFKGTCLGIVPGFATEEVEAEIIKNAKNELLWLVYGDVIKSLDDVIDVRIPGILRCVDSRMEYAILKLREALAGIRNSMVA